MNPAPGYSGKTLREKLGVKPGHRVAVIGYDGDWPALVGADDVVFEHTALDVIHLFVTTEAALRAGLQTALPMLADRGMIWVSWPKKASGVPTEIVEDLIRTVALPMGIVDVKVCAVTDVWSGLKLVRRRAGGEVTRDGTPR